MNFVVVKSIWLLAMTAVRTSMSRDGLSLNTSAWKSTMPLRPLLDAGLGGPQVSSTYASVPNAVHKMRVENRK